MTGKPKPNQLHIWRISVKSDDECKIRFEESFTGTEAEARKRAYALWGNTSYLPNSKTNRDVYVSREVWDVSTRQYRMVKEFRGRMHSSAKDSDGRTKVGLDALK